LEDILDALAPQITAGVPMVVLEPSCASVFADELKSILPRNEDGHRLRSQTKLLGQFLAETKYAPPTLKRKALIHGHCHQKAIFDMSGDQKILAQMGVEADLLDSGCCGLAGSFGYEEHHYDISMKIGERVLLPKIREAPRDTLIVSDGFSCREQIKHATRRQGMHLAEVLQMALRQPLPPPKKFIETGWVQEEPAYPALTAAAGLGLLAAGGLYWLGKNQGRES
jgi:Fe-S oxidoreductase